MPTNPFHQKGYVRAGNEIFPPKKAKPLPSAIETVKVAEKPVCERKRGGLESNPDENNRKSQSPIIESNVCYESLATQKGKGSNPTRFQVRIVSHRRRLCDVDNLCPKYFIDCLRYAEIIKDDAPKYISLEVTQIQSKTDFTEIEVNPID